MTRSRIGILGEDRSLEDFDDEALSDFDPWIILSVEEPF
jgi:hypothetical protein